MELIELEMLRTLPDIDARGDVVSEWTQGELYYFDPGSASVLVNRGDAKTTGRRRGAVEDEPLAGLSVLELRTPGGDVVGTVSWQLSEAWSSVGDVYVPQRLNVEMPGNVREPSLSMTVECRSGVPGFTRIEFVAKDTGPTAVIGAHLATARGRLQYLLDTIVESVASREVPDAQHSPDWADPRTAQLALRGAKRSPRPTKTGRRRRVITTELLTEVARTYRANIDGNPTEQVQHAFRVSYPTAARWVALCRTDEHKLLPKSGGKGKRKA